MKDNLSKQSIEQPGAINNEIAEFRDKLNKNANIRANAIKQFISGKISEEEKKEVVDSLDREKLDLKQSLDLLEQEQTISESSIEYALSFMTNVAKQWANAELQLKQKYQNLIFPRGFVYDIKQHNFISSDISPLYRCISLENTALKASNSVMVNHLTSNWNHILEDINQWYDLLKNSPHARNIPAGIRTLIVS